MLLTVMYYGPDHVQMNCSWKWIAVIASGYPDYPKSGYIRTILATETRCPKSGFQYFSQMNTILEQFFGKMHIIFH